jgi:hypothetical protein
MNKFKWEYCLLCECWMIICWKCGNNTCNAGYGEVDGKPCDVCPSAYNYDDAEIGKPRGLKSAILISIEWVKGRFRLLRYFLKHGKWPLF